MQYYYFKPVKILSKVSGLEEFSWERLQLKGSKFLKITKLLLITRSLFGSVHVLKTFQNSEEEMILRECSDLTNKDNKLTFALFAKDWFSFF